MKKTYIWSGYVSASKHSVFVYDPATDKLYLKIIVVEAKSNKIIDNFHRVIEADKP